MTYQQILSVLNEHDLAVTPSELHGLLSGLIAGGMFKESTEYLDHLSELFNQGQTLPASIKQLATKLVDTINGQLDAQDMSFELVLPVEDDALQEQAEELLNWVQHFLVGFGFNKCDVSKASAEAQEIIEDFTSITRMDTELDDDNESQADFYEVVEFVRVSTVLCHQEFSRQVGRSNSKTLH